MEPAPRESLSVAQEAEELVTLARAKTPAEREQLMLGLASLCQGADTNGMTQSEAVQEMVNDIFMALVVEAERDIRARLAKKLATAKWAPKALINVLALDDIEIARPIIASSPVLGDAELIRLLVEATIEHQIEVARRPTLGPLVVNAIIAQDEPAVLTALAANETARISPDGMAHLVEASRRTPSLRPAPARHPRLTAPLAERLYIWVGQALRAALVSRFPIDAEALDHAIAEAVGGAYADPFAEPTSTPAAEPGAEQEEMERRLIAKLDSSGQLRPGYLVRALQEGRLSLFTVALATLGRFETNHVQRVIDSDRPELLGLACAAVGIDRSVFPSILEMIRRLNGGLPGGGPDGARRAVGAFGPVSAQVAATAFRQAALSV
jgi:uncharacterized protein (DUF2336 family)